MGRQPAARQKIIDASRAIVAERGAGCLTFEEIVQVSGVTRGGITYHFPTKERLLRALVEDDLRQWQELEAELRPGNCPAATAELVATIRSYTQDKPERRRFVAGMLSAVTHDPAILDAVREHEQERLTDDTDIQALILELAAAGLFWADTFACPAIPEDIRGRLIAELERQAMARGRKKNQQTEDSSQ